MDLLFLQQCANLEEHRNICAHGEGGFFAGFNFLFIFKQNILCFFLHSRFQEL